LSFSGQSEEVDVSLEVVILAAGQGTRMRSELPKVLHPLAGRPMVLYAVETARALSDALPVLVVGRGADAVRQVVGEAAVYVEQAEQRGTGHAVLQARERLVGRSEQVVVMYADMPLLSAETLRALVDRQRTSGAAVVMLTLVSDDPRGFGRVVRDERGAVVRIVEEAAATEQERAIRELNAGVYCFDAAWLWQNVDRIPLTQPKGEYYLTDLIGMAVAQGRGVEVAPVADENEVLGINTRVHLAEAEAVLRGRINRQWMEAGVTMTDPATTYIEAEVRIGPDTVLEPGTILRGRTAIGQGCHIGPHTLIVDSTLGDHCRVTFSVVEGAVMEDRSNVGPFGHLRPGARLCVGAHMGNFGEVKNATLGPGAKMGHFSYLGDAEVGAGANIGAGTITCNFDGERKHRTEIGEGAFIGSDTMLVAPVRVGRGAKTGAGSVVTHDVPDGAVAYGVPARVVGETRKRGDAETGDRGEG
jgi:bifunctional UDP-N-acetylglucosamine pyrophosphorylase/glucosamine-1-phosphate N-acetyltransferase